LFADDSKVKSAIFSLIPSGWVYQNMAFYAKLLYQTLIEPLDSGGQYVVPYKMDAAFQRLETALVPNMASVPLHPFRFLASAAIPNLSKATQTTARNQALVNQAQVVCALERYRIAHREYPETLDALVPQQLAKLPADLIGGQPPRYRKSEGKFLLYSIGWSEQDHGGNGGKTVADRMQGDWVWPMDN